MEKGGMKLADIDALLAEADQYCWGDGLLQLPEHVARLRDVKAWVTKACLLSLDPCNLELDCDKACIEACSHSLTSGQHPLPATHFMPQL